MVMAMVMDIMAILIATAMETIVTGIVVIMIQGMVPVVGDEINEQGEGLNKLEAFSLQGKHSHPNHPNLIVPPTPPQGTVTSFDPSRDK
jgi:hypothetical protein